MIKDFIVAIVDELKKNFHNGGILVAFHAIILCAVTTHVAKLSNPS